MIAASLIGMTLVACAAPQQREFVAPPSPCRPAVANWRALATEDDRGRLRRWREAWTQALDQARAAGHGADIAGEGALLEPDVALPGPLPPPGNYRCRTIKLGTPGDLLPYVSYPAFRCRITAAGNDMRLVKLDGSQRPIGRLFADRPRRRVFLGTLRLGDETRSQRYGVDRERDLAGLLERVGESRWRLVFPFPHFESLLDVLELTPAQGSSR